MAWPAFSQTATSASAPSQPAASSRPLEPPAFKPPPWSRNGSGPAGPLWQMLGSAVVILVLGGVCYVLVRRVLPRVAARPGREVRVLESAPLGRNALVHLLKVGEETYLVASSREAVCLLAKVASAESHSSAAPPAAANLSGKVGG